MKAELLVQRLNSKGKVLQEVRQPARSFIKQFIDILYTLHAYLTYTSTDVSNTGRNLDDQYGWGSLQVGGGGGDCLMMLRGGYLAMDFFHGDDIGIQVGSGATAVDPNDYVMETRIAHGIGAGQLLYGGCDVEPLVISAPNASTLIRRFFINKSGGDVTVREIGIYVVAWTSMTSGYIFLIARDVLGAPITVADTELLRVQYTTQVTV